MPLSSLGDFVATDPELVVGWYITRAGGVADRVRVETGELGEDAGAIGAAALVLREIFAGSQEA